MARFLAALMVAGLFLALTPTAAQDGSWRRAESANFVVFSRGRERALREAVQTLESFDALARQVTRASAPPSPVRLTIYLLNDHDALEEAFPGVSRQVGGFYTAQRDFIAAFAVQGDNGWEGGAQQTLFHEYTHHFMLRYFPHAYPAWYIEGFAEYMSTVQFERGRILVGRPSAMRATTLLGDRLLPMTQILAPPREMSREDRLMFYAQSWLFVHYMFSSDERRRAGRAYISAVAEGADPIGAFEPAFGMTPEAFHQALTAYRRGRIVYASYPDQTSTAAQVTVTRMPRSADRLLLAYARLRLARSEEAEAAAAAIVSEEAARFPGDAFAARAAAYAELKTDPARATAARRRPGR